MFLTDEALIIAHLAEALAEVPQGGVAPILPGSDKRVLSAADMASIEESAQITPCVYVIYAGHTPLKSYANGVIQDIEQRWIVVITTRNARATVDGKAVREDAEPIINAVIEALMGFKPDPSGSALSLSSSEAPVYRTGFGYFPFSFTRRRTFRGQ